MNDNQDNEVSSSTTPASTSIFSLRALSAYVCIYFFLKWLNNIGFAPFLIYRLILGGVLLALVYAG